MRTLWLPRLMVFLLIHSTPVFAQEIGRLFFTPEERLELDRLRNKVKPGEKFVEVIASKNGQEETPVVIAKMRVDGFVKRSSGKDTTWINQQPHTIERQSHNVIVDQQLAKPPLVSITLPTGKRLKLKAGQTVDVDSGKVLDVYEQTPEVKKRKKE